ncbi:uncharacterized protein LOC121401383 [Xenopus laevis]|uniref:Uncharacterized protein LOC121401383 n=1 Tax=Xenopus laevis TaxID=8355 RepID=A0A8J1MLJ4_XENLA|nr:uncharacterized protein LOC121401383 [Xenopus laevis]
MCNQPGSFRAGVSKLGCSISHHPPPQSVEVANGEQEVCCSAREGAGRGAERRSSTSQVRLLHLRILLPTGIRPLLTMMPQHRHANPPPHSHCSSQPPYAMKERIRPSNMETEVETELEKQGPVTGLCLPVDTEVEAYVEKEVVTQMKTQVEKHMKTQVEMQVETPVEQEMKKQMEMQVETQGPELELGLPIESDKETNPGPVNDEADGDRSPCWTNTFDHIIMLQWKLRRTAIHLLASFA